LEEQGMTTWITKKDGRIGGVRQTADAGASFGPEWEQVPNDWGGDPDDKLDWFDGNMRRIPDMELVSAGVRKDNRGIWFNKDTMEAKAIHGLDEEPGEDWTREAPLENEPHQKWDEDAGIWVVDAVAEEAPEEVPGQERLIAEKKLAIINAEQRILRSLIAREAGTATAEDEQYFDQTVSEIVSLREELRELIAAQEPGEAAGET
jgi:hypothetical protein